MVRICQDGHVSCQNIQVLHENMQMLELFSAVCVFVLSKCVQKSWAESETQAQCS